MGLLAVRKRGGVRRRYANLLNVVRSLPLLAGFCYTQFADTYQEANGLLYADRTPKFPIEHIALATRGPRSQRDRQIEWAWRERLMNSSAATVPGPQRGPSHQQMNQVKHDSELTSEPDGATARRSGICSIRSGWAASNARARSTRRGRGWT